ncbi:MAG: BREX system ATP-binding protein BrxD [Myxococcota bacterium]
MSQDAVRDEIVYALRQGTVPARGLDLFATGLEPLVAQVKAELEHVGRGHGLSKWLRGDYGAGKTFTARHLAAVARSLGFATSEIQVSVNDTPLHKLETVYRRLTERLETPTDPPSALQPIVDGWLYDVGDKVTRLRGLTEDDPAFPDACEQQIEDELADISRVNPAFAAVLRTYNRAQVDGDRALAQGLLAWLGGQPNTGRALKAEAGVRGEIDGQAALTFLGGLLRLLRQSGHKGLVVVLDEVETIQRIKSDTRGRSLDALRQLMDMLSEDRLPGLYLIVTGTPAFFEGPKGIKELAPLRDRLALPPDDGSGFENLKAPQVRLRAFDGPRLRRVGLAVRDLYPARDPVDIRGRVDDPFVQALVDKLTEGFGGRVDIVPRLFLRTLVDVLDRADTHAEYDPRVHHKLNVNRDDLLDEELEAFERARAPAAASETSGGQRPRRLEE